MKESEDITALVSNRVYPLQTPPNPQMPFIKTGVPIVVPFGASCMDGIVQRMVIHNYAATVKGQLSGEVRAGMIAAEISSLLDGLGLELETPYPARAYITWISNQVVQDGLESGLFHGLTSIEVNVVS